MSDANITFLPKQIEQAAETAWQERYHDDWDDHWKDDYIAGFRAFFARLKESDNPHKESGHERDTTHEDEAHYQWYRGYWDAYSVQNPSKQ